MSIVYYYCNKILEQFPVTSEKEVYEMLYGVILNNIFRDNSVFRNYPSFIVSKRKEINSIKSVACTIDTSIYSFLKKYSNLLRIFYVNVSIKEV